ARGPYGVKIGFDGTYRFDPYLEKVETITVDKSTSTLKLHQHATVIEAPRPPEPHVIEVIQGTQRDYVSFSPVVKPPVPTPTINGDPRPTPPHVIEILRGTQRDLPLQEPHI